jgi:hypothetical protein
MAETEAPKPPEPRTGTEAASFIIAILWAVTATIVALVLFTSTKDAQYGGDAYTGIQNAVVAAVRGIAFLLIGSGALGIIVAVRRN